MTSSGKRGKSSPKNNKDLNYEELYHSLLLRLKDIAENQGRNDYKKQYHSLMKKLNNMDYHICNERCPPLHSCCGACNWLKRILDEEKDVRHKTNPGSDEGLHES